MSPERVKLIRLACLIPCIFVVGWIVVFAIEASRWVTIAQLNHLYRGIDLKNGMTKPEVIAMLGTPLSDDGSVILYYAWCKRTDPIYLFFGDDGRLVNVR